ncbi:hypothetical protein [Nocardioides daeguensis]|uniref:Uncharacterized protein n=1 Tax=Nocardioides daeguensis TaxID=908359 RepID=A0ABP6VA13_9ACTN|nr:hypothetical protein [Nocardioides daeguensis]MBV6726087.1 hypothetical protein [Nocardioides daeguensis]MCR1771930.1 hypothetical protein [Nocardioides daeguensis]
MENRPDPREAEHAGEGQVSEVGNLDDAGEVESPADAVAGHPTDRDVQEGKAGPDARTGNQDQEERR